MSVEVPKGHMAKPSFRSTGQTCSPEGSEEMKGKKYGQISNQSFPGHMALGMGVKKHHHNCTTHPDPQGNVLKPWHREGDHSTPVQAHSPVPVPTILVASGKAEPEMRVQMPVTPKTGKIKKNQYRKP